MTLVLDYALVFIIVFFLALGFSAWRRRAEPSTEQVVTRVVLVVLGLAAVGLIAASLARSH